MPSKKFALCKIATEALKTRKAAHIRALLCVSASLWLLFSFFATGCSDKKPEGVRIGETAPDFSLSDQNGKVHSLAEYKGKVLLIRFWADWCPNCKEEMPRIDEVYKGYKDKGFNVLGVNVKQSEAAVSAFVNDYKITFPTPLDKEAVVAKQYGVIGLPTTFVIDKDGKIREKIMGDMVKADVEKLIAPLL